MSEETPDAQQAETPSPQPPQPPQPPQFDIDKAFRLNDERALEGAPIRLAEGVEIGVARMYNPRYAEKLLKFYRANKFAIERNLLEQNEADEKLCRLLAETIFVWMRGISYQGAPLDDTVEKRTWALMTYPMLREKVVEESQNVANFRAAELEDEGKS